MFNDTPSLRITSLASQDEGSFDVERLHNWGARALRLGEERTAHTQNIPKYYEAT